MTPSRTDDTSNSWNVAAARHVDARCGSAATAFGIVPSACVATTAAAACSTLAPAPGAALVLRLFDLRLVPVRQSWQGTGHLRAPMNHKLGFLSFALTFLTEADRKVLDASPEDRIGLRSASAIIRRRRELCAVRGV
jgi:hypothetical protein